MIVMKPTATEEDIQAVIARIESCGARAHPSRGEEVTVIGAIGDREHVQRLGLEGHQGVEQVVPILRPVQALLVAVSSWRTICHRGRRTTGRRRQLHDDRRPVHRRVARPDAVHGAHRGRRRRVDVPRRRVQAALVAVLVPGARAGGPAPAGRGEGADRAADRHRADGRARRRADPRGRRRDPGRRPQHAELPAAGRDRPHRQAGADEARPVLDAGRAADGGRVRAQGGQPERDAVRARHPHVRDRLPLHARHHGRADAQGALAPARDRRPVARAGPARHGPAAVAGRGRGGRGRDHRRGPPEPRRGHLRRAAADLRGLVRAPTSSRSSAPRRWPARS